MSSSTALTVALAAIATARRARIEALSGLLPVGEVVTAQSLADSLQVSPRVVYRYIVELRAAGERIAASTGKGGGYMRRRAA